MSQSQIAVKAFFEACAKVRASYQVRGCVVTVAIYFTPGDGHAYGCAENDAGALIGLIPARGGSIWGTDGASVGGFVGLREGRMVLNVSGVAKRFTAALVKHSEREAACGPSERFAR